MKLLFSLFLPIISYIKSLTIEFSSSTVMERACNWEHTDFSYFNIDNYSDNGFLIFNIFSLDNFDINKQKTSSTGTINVNVYESAIGNKIKKSMDCKYTSMPNFEILFCDILNRNKIYYGIQLLNDGGIKFSSNYNKNIMTCNSAQNIPLTQKIEKENENTDTTKNNDYNNKDPIIDKTDNIEKNENKNTDSTNNDNQIQKNKDNNSEQNNNNIEKKIVEKKKKYFWFIQRGFNRNQLCLLCRFCSYCWGRYI